MWKGKRKEIFEREIEGGMMERTRWTKEVNKLVMRCFYPGNPTRKDYRK